MALQAAKPTLLAALALLCAGAAARAGESASGAAASAAAAHAETASAAARFDRGQWGLDEAEWRRYQALMAGVRGSLSPPTLSPVEVLGIHAGTEAERDKYARRFARIMKEDAERVLAFQRAYDKAWREINPSGLVADAARLPQSPGPDRSRPGDRLLLFTRTGGCPDCERLARAALAGRRDGARLDIYFTGGTDDAIRQWAAAHGVDPADVRERRTTLNHENGELARAAPGRAAPALARIRGGKATLLEDTQGNP